MANYPVTPGDYYIIPATKTDYAIDILYGKMSNGQPVEIYRKAGTTGGGGSDSQRFNVSYRENETAQIASYIVGKCLDIPGGTISPGGVNVQRWTDNDTRAQEWTIESSGETIYIDDVAYSTYYICSTVDTDFRMTYDASSFTLCVRDWTGSTEVTQHERYQWAFLPIPKFRSGGLYEIIPKGSTNVRLDVSGGETTNGANVHIWAKNGLNPQKFVISDTGDGWHIRNIASGKYVDVNGASFTAGTNVQSWEENNSRAQLWAIDLHDDTVTVDNVVCPVVRFGANNELVYSMDISNSADNWSYRSGTNVIIWTTHEEENQLFCLKPTNAVDSFMPTPYMIGMADTLGASVNDTVYLNQNGTVWSAFKHLAWNSADAWANKGANSFQWCYNYQDMLAVNSTWGMATTYTDWQTALVTRQGNRYDITKPFDFSLDDTIKARTYIFKIRACGPDSEGLQLLVGPEATKTITVYKMPTITLSNPKLAADGLVFDFTTNYSGVNVLVLDSITNYNTGAVYLSQPYRIKQYDDETKVVVPYSYLKNLPPENSSLTVSAHVGTDLFEPTTDTQYFYNLPVSYDTSQDISVSYVNGKAHTTTLRVPDSLSAVHVYMITESLMYECERLPQNSVAGFNDYMVPYPFGVTYDILVVGMNGETWCMHRETMPKQDKALHAWNYNGIGCVLECRPDEYLSTAYILGIDNSVQSLNDREWQFTQFGPTKNGQFTADGALVPGYTESSYSAFENLVGKHALYRSVSGDICWVAVTNITRDTDYLYSRLTVTMNKESL